MGRVRNGKTCDRGDLGSKINEKVRTTGFMDGPSDVKCKSHTIKNESAYTKYDKSAF